MTNGRCRMHGGTSPGAPKSNGHALEHGRYTAEAITEQREFAALVRDMKGLVEQVEGDEEQAGPFPDQGSPVKFLPAILVCGR